MSLAGHKGACLCGACRFTAQAEDHAHACHCSICRKWTGGMNMAVSCTDVVWNDGAPLKAYRSSDWAERVFCAECGNDLYWRALDGDPARQVLGLMAFDDPAAFPLTSQIYIDEKPDTYALANETAMLTGAEVEAQFADSPEGNA